MKTEAKHTPEPWDYSEYVAGMADTWMGGEPPEYPFVCIAGRDDYPDHVILWSNSDLNTKVQDANVRRVVACVNALAGVPTGDLEAMLALELPDADRVEKLVSLLRHYKQAAR